MEKDLSKKTTPFNDLNALNDTPTSLCNKIIQLALNDAFASKLEDDTSNESKAFNLAVQYLDKKDTSSKELIFKEIQNTLN